MDGYRFNPAEISPPARDFYRRALETLRGAGVPFLVGGSFALEAYTEIERPTKDLDLFLQSSDRDGALAALAAAGYATEVVFPHWLAKGYRGADYLDLIFSSGNGVCSVDASWFDHAAPAEVLDVSVHLCPVEEMIWQQSFVMERERYDGAAVAHLFRSRARRLDWPRLLRRFGPNWRVLLAHLILFGYVYPGHRADVPAVVLDELLARARREASDPPPGDRLCRGTLLSRAQYLIDIRGWGYQDARLMPHGQMSQAEVDRWTEPIEADSGGHGK